MMALPVSGNHLRRVRDVDMKRDYAFVVCISLPLFYADFTQAKKWKKNMLFASSHFLLGWCMLIFASVIFFLGLSA